MPSGFKFNHSISVEMTPDLYLVPSAAIIVQTAEVPIVMLLRLNTGLAMCWETLDFIGDN